MAIVMDERRTPGSGIISVFIWLILLGSVAVGVFYVFVKKPELIPITPPKGFKDAQAVSKIKLEAEPVVSKLNPPHFDSHITVPPARTSGRSNPFLGF